MLTGLDCYDLSVKGLGTGSGQKGRCDRVLLAEVLQRKRSGC